MRVLAATSFVFILTVILPLHAQTRHEFVINASLQNRHIDRARPLIEDLIGAGMFLDDEFLDRVLEAVEE